MTDQNVQGEIIDHESMLTFGRMSKDAFAEFAKPRYYLYQTETKQKKWISELHKIAVDYAKAHPESVEEK